MSRSTDKATAFLELLQPLQARLEGYCRRMLRKGNQLEDVLQTVVARAFSQFHRYAEGTNFNAWIFRIATLEIFNRNRKREPLNRDILPGDLQVENSAEFVNNEEAFAAMLHDPEIVLEHFDDVVVGALARLSPHERAVLLLRSIAELRYQEIHELLGIPLGSVMGYLSRARWKMRKALRDYALQQGLRPRQEIQP